jgi:hypothetical protein
MSDRVIKEKDPEEDFDLKDINNADDSKINNSEDYDEDDERVARSDDNDDDKSDSEREVIRNRRRKEKIDRKQRRDEAIKRDKIELDFLRSRNDNLERRVSAQEQRTHSLDLSAFDSEISKAANEAELADRVIAKAIEIGNGEDVTKAMNYRDRARDRIQQLSFQKQQVSVRRPEPKQIDDLTMRHAQEFISENPWYDSQGRDEESSIVIAIDKSLAKDGFDSRSSDYWDELRRRAARRLPDRFGKEESSGRDSNDRGEQRREPRGGPAVGSGREYAPPSTRQESYLSEDRKQALIEAGAWDDLKLRKRYMKRYADYDRANRA